MICLVGCASWDAQRQLQLAKTPQQEAAEFKRISGSPETYRIEFLDKNGQHLVEWDKDLSKVAMIVIRWPSGVVARHRVLDPVNIQVLLAE